MQQGSLKQFFDEFSQFANKFSKLKFYYLTQANLISRH